MDGFPRIGGGVEPILLQERPDFGLNYLPEPVLCGAGLKGIRGRHVAVAHLELAAEPIVCGDSAIQRAEEDGEAFTGSFSKKTPPKKTAVSDRWNHYTFKSVLAVSKHHPLSPGLVYMEVPLPWGILWSVPIDAHAFTVAQVLGDQCRSP